MIRKSIISGAIVAFIACDGGGGVGTDPNVVESVTVTANPTQISVNGTSQATATAKNAAGGTISGKTATWQSLTPTVASVNASTGVVTGVSAGSATIQGTVDGKSGNTTVTVIAAVSACNTGLTTVDLAVGGVRTLTSASTQGCIKVPAATSAAADYLVIPANLNSTTDIVGNYVFKSDEGELVPATNKLAATSLSGAFLTAQNSETAEGLSLQSKFETRLRVRERRELNLPVAQTSYQDRKKAGAVRYSVSTAIPAVGDKQTFKVPGQTNSCNNFTTITAEAKYINDKVIIFSDVASPPGGFTNTEYQQIGDEFRDLIYPTDLAYFGTPLDDDNNGRIIILYTPEVNKLTPTGNPSSFVGGFFWAGDLFPVSDPNPNNACPQSNVAEMFYLLTPDPTGTFNNIRNTTTVRQGTRGTIAHEFQHMINASERIRSPILQEFEDVWLDEGLAHFAEDAVGRVVRGLGETEDAGFSRVLGGSADDFNAFFNQNFARFRLYLLEPGFRSPASDDFGGDSLAYRGAAWALLRYAADQYAPGGDVKSFTKKLAGGPLHGVQNLTTAASGVAWDVLVSGWLIANYADNFGIPNLNSLYTYKVYDMRSIESALNNGNYPLKVTAITGPSFAASGQRARSGSGNYFSIVRPQGVPARTFRFLNTDGTTAASFTGASWVILRTR